MNAVSTVPLVDVADCREALLDYFRVRGFGVNDPVPLAPIADWFRYAFSSRQISEELARMMEDGLIVQGGSAFGIKLTSRGVRALCNHEAAAA